ncbi:MAG TPA: hypothetical protein VNW92_17620 [Polyangiaceae bacterium]|jgi:hypothetical protein|nr:hypothetical protein [Polyangiaceae bacterium]
MKWATILALGLALAACKRADVNDSERCPALDAGTPVDPVLLAFLSRARAAHHIADEAEITGDLPAAVAPLAALTAGPLPHGNGALLAPEVREVLADTRARLADLRSRQGAFELAIADVQAGLETAPEPNYFRGHLLETEGLVEERQAKALEATAPSAAAAARARAIALLEQAMAVQAGVIDSAAPESAKPANSAAPPRPGPSTAP